MFKKERDLAERSKTLLKNKEVRSLKTEIVKQFPNVQEDELNSVIPNKADITLTKLANKTLLYSIDGVILFFDVNARNNLYPTLPFLWRFPNALPTLIIYSPVSEFVLRGADLMTPGLCTSLLPTMSKLGLREGDKACVRIVGNPLPFAVGDCLFNTSILADGVRHKGRALTVHHVYGDLLSTSGVVPNAGFGPSRIYPIETAESVGETAQHDIEDEGDSSDDNDEGSEGEGEGEGEGDEGGSGDKVEEGGAEAGVEEETGEDAPDAASTLVDELNALAINNNNNTTDNITTDTNADSDTEHDPTTNTDTANPDHDTDTTTNTDNTTTKLEQQQVQDALLLHTVLLATKYVIKDKQLPMLVSTYWTILQRCAAASNTSLNLKQSSYRKVTSFLTHCQSLSLLTLHDEQGVSTITSLNKTHDMFRGVKVDNPELFKTTVTTSTTTSSTSSAEEGVSEFAAFQMAHSASSEKNKKVQVLELFKLTKHLKDIFGVPRGEYGEYLKPAEVRDILVMYIKSHNLEYETDRSCLLIPPADGLHSILAAYSSANKSSNSGGKSGSGSGGVSSGTSGSSGASSVGSGVGNVGVGSGGSGVYSDEYNGMEGDYSDYIDPLDDNYVPPSASVSSGVYGSSGMYGATTSSDIKMKVAQGGLKSVDSSGGYSASTTDYPALGTTSTTNNNTNTNTNTSTTLGVGGWGVDKGTAWKPVSLSTARANTSANTSTTTKSANNKTSSSHTANAKTSMDTEFPTLGSSGAGSSTSASSKKSKHVVYSELPSDLVMKKEEVFKGVMKKMSPYFAVISQTGGMTVHSGQIPKAKVIVENRMGNKAVTILRGLEVFAIDLAALTKECQKKFACSCALGSVPGIPKDKEIVIQGNLAYEVEAYLSTTKGVPKSLIEIDTAKGAKLKKKK